MTSSMAALRNNSITRHTDADRDSRIEDYLNDKLQTRADLSNIDTLLEDLKQQHALLNQQLREAKSKHQTLSKETQQHREQLLQRSKAFKAQQSDIDRRLRIVTESETSDDAITKFESSLSTLQRLEVAQTYVELLRKIEELTSEAHSNFSKSPQAALRPYVELQNIGNALRAAQPAAEDAAPHLVDHVQHMARSLWKQMKDSFASDFEKTLKKIHWPGKDIILQGKLKDEWVQGVYTLLELQEPELRTVNEVGRKESHSQVSLVLLPLEVMVKPLELRFKYHFEGDRPTNKLDKPEYFLSHVEGILDTYDDFFATYLQPILSESCNKKKLALKSIYVDSTAAFITAVLPMLRNKVFSVMPSVSRQAPLLSHFIHELMCFDVRIREDWKYDAGNSTEGWKGLTWEVLNKKGWFDQWLQVEKRFALNRYRDIVNAPESHEIDYDSVDPGMTKPTFAAVRVNDLLETITDRYKPLASFSQKIQFIIGVQIEIFDQYHQRLFDSLSKYQMSSSSLGRTIQGDSQESAAEVSGLKGIEHLCRIYGSAEYLEKKMRDWSDDLFFIELYEELQDRVRGNRPGKAVAGPMSIEAVAERTSSTVAPGSAQNEDEDNVTESGALFDETASAYRSLRIRTESILTEALTASLRETLKAYGRINPWSSLSAESFPTSTSSELDPFLQTVQSNLSLLSKTLARAPLRRIGRQICLAIQAVFWDNVLMYHTFSSGGISQFIRDVEVVWETLDRYLGSRQAVAGMRKLKDAMVLLSLPNEKRSGAAAATTDANSFGGNATDADEDDDLTAWDADEDADGDKDIQTEETDADAGGDEASQDKVQPRTKRGDTLMDIGLGLWEVEKRVFRSNESAREVLEELGLDALTEMDARKVMERIIEVGDGGNG